MSKKVRLLQMLEFCQEELLNFANSISSTGRNQSGTQQKWAERDILAHIGESYGHLANRIACGDQGTVFTDEDDLNTENNRLFEKNRSRPFEEILEMISENNSAVINAVRSFSEDDLMNSELFVWQNGRQLWRYIAGITSLHTLSHLDSVYIARGEYEVANQLRERETELNASLDDSPQWSGISEYNLACHYALMGDKENALKHLEPSLHLYPDLIEWSVQDSDLISLHKDQDFKEIAERMRLEHIHVNPALDRARLTETLETALDYCEQVVTSFDYRLVGTGAALLHGVDLPAGDIDILVRDRAAVDTFAGALSMFTLKTLPTWLADQHQYFTEFNINGVDFGVSTVEVETKNDTDECTGSGPWIHYAILPCGKLKVPTVALELHLITELARQRKERYEPLIEALKERGFDVELLKRGMQARQIPPERQKEVLKLMGFGA